MQFQSSIQQSEQFQCSFRAVFSNQSNFRAVRAIFQQSEQFQCSFGAVFSNQSSFRAICEHSEQFSVDPVVRYCCITWINWMFNRINYDWCIVWRDVTAYDSCSKLIQLRDWRDMPPNPLIRFRCTHIGIVVVPHSNASWYANDAPVPLHNSIPLIFWFDNYLCRFVELEKWRNTCFVVFCANCI